MVGKKKLKREGRCRLCPCRTHLTMHHLIPKARFRDGTFFRAASLMGSLENLVPLCRNCHTVIEKHTVMGLRARARLRDTLRGLEVAFVVRVAGQEWLDERYPLADDKLALELR